MRDEIRTRSNSPQVVRTRSDPTHSTASARLADLGVERIVIPPLAFDADNIRETLARYGDEVIAKA